MVYCYRYAVTKVILLQPRTLQPHFGQLHLQVHSLTHVQPCKYSPCIATLVFPQHCTDLHSTTLIRIMIIAPFISLRTSVFGRCALHQKCVPQYAYFTILPFLSFRSFNSCLRLLPRLPPTSTFLSVTCLEGSCYARYDQSS